VGDQKVVVFILIVVGTTVRWLDGGLRGGLKESINFCLEPGNQKCFLTILVGFLTLIGLVVVMLYFVIL